MNHWKTDRRVRPTAVLAALAIAWIAGSGQARPADQASPPAAAAPDSQARALLLVMAHFIGEAPGFRVTMRSDYDAIQPDGESIEFGEQRQIQMQRPDKLRIEVERGDGERGMLLFDGRSITAFNASEQVYARVDRPGSLDQALIYMVRDLRATLPLARMFTTTFAKDVERRATAVRFVEDFRLFDVPTTHVAVTSAEVDWQLWIAQGAEPLPRRVVITYKNAPGQPQFRADLYDWRIVQQAGANAFVFVPPAGAEQIMYLAPRSPGNPGPGTKGEPR